MFGGASVVAGGGEAGTGAASKMPIGEDGKPDRSALMLKRRQSSKVKSMMLEQMIQKMEKERDQQKKKEEEEAKRRKRLAAYEASLTKLYEHQWEFVDLIRLPYDVAPGVLVREPKLSDVLARLIRLYFAELFDIYLYYAKVDADSGAPDLYKMTDFNWKTLLKEAQVVGTEAGMFRTDVSTHIFKTVNQRRDNMEQAKGKANLEQAEYAQAAMKVCASKGALTQSKADTVLHRACVLAL